MNGESRCISLHGEGRRGKSFLSRIFHFIAIIFDIFMQSEDRGISKLDGKEVTIISTCNLTESRVAVIFGIKYDCKEKRNRNCFWNIT